MSILGLIVRRLITTPDIVRAVWRGSEKIDGIEVYGRQEFRRAVIRALLLLRDKKLPAWDTLTQHVGSILEARLTEAVVTARPAFMFVSGPNSSQDPEFLAGAIAFMACSIQLHRTYESEFPGRRVPPDVYSSGSAARERCEKAYHECLLALGKGPEKTQSHKSPDPQ
jgi:hypothetical protein